MLQLHNNLSIEHKNTSVNKTTKCQLWKKAQFGFYLFISNNKGDRMQDKGLWIQDILNKWQVLRESALFSYFFLRTQQHIGN